LLLLLLLLLLSLQVLVTPRVCLGCHRSACCCCRHHLLLLLLLLAPDRAPVAGACPPPHQLTWQAYLLLPVLLRGPTGGWLLLAG
jgi:hypothetical protein